MRSNDPAFDAREISQDIRISKNGTYKRLKKLHDRGLLESKKIGQGRGWWLSDAGKAYLKNPDDERILDY